MQLAGKFLIGAGVLYCIRMFLVARAMLNPGQTSIATDNFLHFVDFLVIGALLAAVVCAAFAWASEPILSLLERWRLKANQAETVHRRNGTIAAWLMDGRRTLAIAILLVALLGAWMFRYEYLGNGMHKNRFTGATCHFSQSCWFCNGVSECE
jgi:hypothetical protein